MKYRPDVLRAYKRKPKSLFGSFRRAMLTGDGESLGARRLYDAWERPECLDTACVMADLSASTSSLPPPRTTPHTQTSTLTPEVQATLARLSTHKNVQGVLILARGGGGIIQSVGAAFEDLERGRAYAKLVRDLVDTMAKRAEPGDDLRLMRIRTTRHELIISPDERYLLVVLQDPAQ